MPVSASLLSFTACRVLTMPATPSLASSTYFGVHHTFGIRSNSCAPEFGPPQAAVLPFQMSVAFHTHTHTTSTHTPSTLYTFFKVICEIDRRITVLSCQEAVMLRATTVPTPPRQHCACAVELVSTIPPALDSFAIAFQLDRHSSNVRLATQSHCGALPACLQYCEVPW